MNTLKEKLKKDIILMDGAFGTYAYALGLSNEHFKDILGCMEYLSAASPEFVSMIHSNYLEAGSDAVETNTFGGNEIKLGEYGLAHEVYNTNLVSTKLARAAADSFSSRSFPRYVVGTLGPTGKLPSSTDPVLGDISYEQLKKIFFDQTLGIIDGGADALLIETGQDMLEMKAAVNGVKEALKDRRKDLVIMTQCTLANNGRMLLGTEMSSFMATMGYVGADVIGVNCSTGPVEMEGTISFLSDNCPAYVSCVPNAGLPVDVDGRTVYSLKPLDMAELMAKFLSKYRLDVIGGCCGTTPEHIKCIRDVLKNVKKQVPPPNRFYASSYSGFDLDKAKRPIKVGERINTQGSRKMKELLKADDYDTIIEMGKVQYKAGADILDVCSVLTERSTEKKDSVILVSNLAESVGIPLMIDSTDQEVIKAALECYPGTAFINSANLEDGGEKARAIFSLAKEHGSFIVNLVIDKKGMGKKVGRKLEIADKLYKIAVKECGIEPHRLIFDMLTFTLGTGEDEYADSAMSTYEAIKKVKKRYPGVMTILGVSNVSFGLPKSARRVLNMVYLEHAVRAGLDLAIVNPNEFLVYEDIPDEEKKLSEDLIFFKHPDSLKKVIECFEKEEKGKGQVALAEKKTSDLTIEERLKACVAERDKAGIISVIDEAMETLKPEVIINEVLMDAMKEVGEKLDKGEVVLPYVLQSAEVMRKAIEYLRKFMFDLAVKKQGKVLLATVLGDVHDIGKNLVGMLLKNNGFTVIDLGKQVPIERIIKEAKKHRVDAIGLSALLVSTARYMNTCIQLMHDAGMDYPVLIGGAPTNKEFAKGISVLKDKSVYKGGIFYSRDAFTGLKIMQVLTDADKRQGAMDEYHGQFAKEAGSPKEKEEVQTPAIETEVSAEDIPEVPFYGVRSLVNVPADEVFKYLDTKILFNIAWGAKVKDPGEKARLIEEEYMPLFKELKEEAIRKGWLDLKAVYGYFRSRAADEELEIFSDTGEVIEKIHFPGGKGKKISSLADYFYRGQDKYDVTAFQAVTVGEKINKVLKDLTDKGEIARVFFLHGMSVYLTEALAAYIHNKIREELQLDPGQGERYSPGYPLWKNLEDQEKIFRLLNVEELIEVRLTDSFQMVPEQSTTAMIVFNKRAKY